MWSSISKSSFAGTPYIGDYIPNFPGRPYQLREDQVEIEPTILKCTWSPLTKTTLEKEAYEACSGEFGTPQQLVWFEAPFREHHLMTNELFLDGGTAFALPKDPTSTTESALSAERDEGGSTELREIAKTSVETKHSPDRRALIISAVADEGMNLENCIDGDDLCDCLLHAMLGMASDIPLSGTH